MNNQKKIKIEMLYGYLTELHEDIKKFREGCTSDIYDSLSLSLEFAYIDSFTGEVVWAERFPEWEH